MRNRFTITFLIALGAAAIAASAALAHTGIKSTSPARGGTAKTSTKSVRITFKEQIRSGSIRVTRGSQVVSKGKGGRDPRNVRRLVVSLKGGLRAGKYRASWKIVAADGDDQKGSFSFRLRR